MKTPTNPTAMDILITDQSIEPQGTSHINAAAGKVSAYVSQFRGCFVTVLCHNASSRRMGAGRTFHGAEPFEEALAAYKSPEMKAIIRAARDVFEQPANVIPFVAPVGDSATAGMVGG